jgi:hypothetical protein
MTRCMQTKHLIVVAACIGATALAAGPARAQQPDSATINGTIGSPVYGDHTWTLTLQGLSYSYHVAPSNYLFGTMTRVYATSFDFEFQGPHAAELNANVSEPLINSGLQNGPVVQMISFTYFDEDWDWWVDARDWFIAVKPSDYQQGLSFRSETIYGGEGGTFATDTNGYPVLAPFTSFGVRTYVNDNRPGSGYSMGIYDPYGTVSVSSVGFSLPGDHNRDGAVDAADYVVWRNSPGNFGGDPGGYNTWRSNLGRTTGSGAMVSADSNIAVPEPGGLAWLILTVPALLGRRKYPRI